MKHVLLASSVSLSLLAACAHAQEAPQQTEDHDHGGLPASVLAFHDVLSQDWHADAGAERTASTCQNIASYHERANTVVLDAAPADITASDWETAATALAAAVDALDTTCASEDRAAFEGDFSSLHDRFHDLITLAPEG